MRAYFAFFASGSALVLACGGSVAQPFVDAGSSDGAKDVATGDGGSGCNANTDCRSDGYCDFHGRCAISSNRYGKCIFKPTNCPPQTKPTYVCGCDGKSYPSECEAKILGVDINNQGGCASPGKEFVACGPLFCNTLSEYCIITSNDALIPTDPVPFTYGCAPLPVTCPNKPADCQCFPTNFPCAAGQCSVSNGLVTMKCPGG